MWKHCCANNAHFEGRGRGTISFESTAVKIRHVAHAQFPPKRQSCFKSPRPFLLELQSGNNSGSQRGFSEIEPPKFMLCSCSPIISLNAEPWYFWGFGARSSETFFAERILAFWNSVIKFSRGMLPRENIYFKTPRDQNRYFRPFLETFCTIFIYI